MKDALVFDDVCGMAVVISNDVRDFRDRENVLFLDERVLKSVLSVVFQFSAVMGEKLLNKTYFDKERTGFFHFLMNG